MGALDESEDEVALEGRQAPVRPVGGQGYGGERRDSPVVGGEVGEGEPGEHVAVHGEPTLVLEGELPGSQLHAAAAPQGDVLHRVVDLDPEAAPVADAVLDDLGPVADGHHRMLDARRGEPDELVLAHGDAGHLDHGFGPVLGVGAKPGCLTARQNHCLSHLRSSIGERS